MVIEWFNWNISLKVSSSNFIFEAEKYSFQYSFLSQNTFKTGNRETNFKNHAKHNSHKKRNFEYKKD